MEKEVYISFKFCPNYGDYEGLIEHRCIDGEWSWSLMYFGKKSLETNGTPPYEVYKCKKCSKVLCSDTAKAMLFLQKMLGFKSGIPMETSTKQNPDIDDMIRSLEGPRSR
jgi:hypothetical protein